MARKSISANGNIGVSALKHKDKRKNIPTEELRDFVALEENAPKIQLYPRDTSLDPQLVWKGKDEQDQNPLEIPVVPIYIQEKIHPQVIVENVRAEAKAGKSVMQQSLFADFNGIQFEDLVEFYQHEQNWANRMILGDSLLVMTSLAEKEGLKGKVQMIYMDPPYGIKFGSNWQVSTRKRDIKDGKVEDVTRQPEQIRAFRDTWEWGIHSYLAYLRDRLMVAHELLTETGSIFVQIGDENVHLVRCLLDEVFGGENAVALIPFRKKLMPLGGKTLESMNDYLIWYAKSESLVKYRQLFLPSTPRVESRWTSVELADGTRRKLTTEERKDLLNLPVGARPYRIVSQTAPSYSETGVFTFEMDGRSFRPPAGQSWVTTIDRMNVLRNIGRLEVEQSLPGFILYHDDFPFSKMTSPWMDTAPAQSPLYVVQTNQSVIERCLLMTTDPGDLVIDPTCGSGTTAYVAEQWGRRWITIDTSRVALALARTRLMSAKFPYYILSDSQEGQKLEVGLTGKIPPDYKTEQDIRKGFVYKRVPHVTLKSIANNPEIKEGMTREEIDIAIAKYADTELLYDKPYEDNKRIRVTGPFTVESLSPHRVLAADEELPASESNARQSSSIGQFETMILDNLKRAGVQNTVKNERLVFNTLDSYAGEWINAFGEFTDKDEKVKRVAVSIGPEHGTVGPEQVKEAAKEAMKGVGFDLLIVLGFAFDAHAGETAKQFTGEPTIKPDGFAVAENLKQYGKLTILLARMNPDLAMGDELLKKTGAANLFMVFGEPDLKIVPEKNGKIVVEIKGLDVYDPTTGQIRNSSTDDIACWFLDTNYNGESFFVRHAYFTGADEPYEKLKRALRAEVNESAWTSLYSTKSIPFDPPETGKIAIKVINHYGDEVLKVYKI